MEYRDYAYHGCLILRRFYDDSWLVIRDGIYLNTLPRKTSYKQARRLVKQMIDKHEIELAPLPCTAPVPCDYRTDTHPYYKQEGINPMYTASAKTSASVTDVSINMVAPVSDAAKQREFLIKEFDNLYRYTWQTTQYEALTKQFNIGAPKLPKSSQEIIDAFKNGRVEIDQKKVDKQTAFFKNRDYDDDFDDDYEDGITGRYFGIKFLDLPVADRKGFEAAVAEFDKAKTDLRRKLHIVDPEAGLEALTAFADWKPTPKTDTVH